MLEGGSREVCCKGSGLQALLRWQCGASRQAGRRAHRQTGSQRASRPHRLAWWCSASSPGITRQALPPNPVFTPYTTSCGEGEGEEECQAKPIRQGGRLLAILRSGMAASRLNRLRRCRSHALQVQGGPGRCARNHPHPRRQRARQRPRPGGDAGRKGGRGVQLHPPPLAAHGDDVWQVQAQAGARGQHHWRRLAAAILRAAGRRIVLQHAVVRRRRWWLGARCSPAPPPGLQGGVMWPGLHGSGGSGLQSTACGRGGWREARRRQQPTMCGYRGSVSRLLYALTGLQPPPLRHTRQNSCWVGASAAAPWRGGAGAGERGAL